MYSPARAELFVCVTASLLYRHLTLCAHRDVPNHTSAFVLELTGHTCGREYFCFNHENLPKFDNWKSQVTTWAPGKFCIVPFSLPVKASQVRVPTRLPSSATSEATRQNQNLTSLKMNFLSSPLSDIVTYKKKIYFSYIQNQVLGKHLRTDVSRRHFMSLLADLGILSCLDVNTWQGTRFPFHPSVELL